MRKHYDFSNAIKNPYSKKLKTQITIRIESEVVEYFKKLASQEDIPYQKLINLFLRDCAQQQKRPLIKWTPPRLAS
jgi:predicted DNA binding CopG/RHH family protein